jgi:hypothetical protein
MRAIALIGPMAMVLLGPFMVPVIAADKDRPFGEPPPPGRHVEERPFGGPPPKHRRQEPPAETQYGKKCRTESQTCGLEKQQPVGDKCTCPGTRAAPGTIIE